MRSIPAYLEDEDFYRPLEAHEIIQPRDYIEWMTNAVTLVAEPVNPDAGTLVGQPLSSLPLVDVYSRQADGTWVLVGKRPARGWRGRTLEEQRTRSLQALAVEEQRHLHAPKYTAEQIIEQEEWVARMEAQHS